VSAPRGKALARRRARPTVAAGPGAGEACAVSGADAAGPTDGGAAGAPTAPGRPGALAGDAGGARRARAQARLRRIEGQVRGVQRMVEDGRHCPEVLDQLSAIEEALRGVTRELVAGHLEHCAPRALRGTRDEAAAMVDELVRLFARARR
jgi:DNA-binding FrmR family transcriptional regulator